ncbi:MAG: glycosyltransferase family 39 protein [Candidatus Sulfopaludibacter sp.]|nr:glycosyltransferase family 39 protein [Candidatus Sulfopaludibacter sp.]
MHYTLVTIQVMRMLMTPSRRGVTITAGALVLSVTAAKLCLHLYAGRSYGFFVDELYYMACAHHLAWGYVDQPPLIAAMAWLVLHLLGDSLPALRFLPAVAGAAEVALTALIARQMGGKRFAQALAAIAVLVAPGILGLDNLFTMNAFEPVIWLACANLAIRIVKTGKQRLWIWFGLLAGVGLENKYSMLLFGGGIVVGLVLTLQRRAFTSPWLWIAGALALLLFLPNLMWNAQHHFPFLELQQNIRRSGRDVPLGPVAFFAQEALAMHPLTVPLWLAGLWFYFFSRAGRAFRTLGWAWLFTAAAIVAMSPRIYYLFPAYPLLFAGGAVWWERVLARPRAVWLQFAWPGLLLVTGALLAPIAIPILSPANYIAYTRWLHLEQPRLETQKLGPLPQIFADQFGWREMTATVARVYNGLPPEVRTKTAIFGQNYGQAGAIDRFGPEYGLPPAISGHQSYFLWGPGHYTGESIIVMDGRRRDLEQNCTTVQDAAHVEHPYSMPYEHFDVFYCTGLKTPLRELWPKLKSWD